MIRGTILGGAVTPIAFAIMNSKANRLGCTLAAPIGLASGLIAWLVTTSTLNGGVINVTTSGQNYPMLAGNLASIGVSFIISVATTYIWPQHYDFSETRALKTVEQTADGRVVHHGGLAETEKDSDADEDISDKKSVTPTAAEVEEAEREQAAANLDPHGLEKAYKFAVWASVILFVVLILVVRLSIPDQHCVC